MNLVSEIKEIEKNFSSKILFDEDLSKYSWFSLGGPAKIIFKPKNLNELSLFLKKTNRLAKICSNKVNTRQFLNKKINQPNQTNNST